MLFCSPRNKPSLQVHHHSVLNSVRLPLARHSCWKSICFAKPLHLTYGLLHFWNTQLQALEYHSTSYRLARAYLPTFYWWKDRDLSSIIAWASPPSYILLNAPFDLLYAVYPATACSPKIEKPSRVFMLWDQNILEKYCSRISTVLSIFHVWKCRQPFCTYAITERSCTSMVVGSRSHLPDFGVGKGCRHAQHWKWQHFPTSSLPFKEKVSNILGLLLRLLLRIHKWLWSWT